MKKIAKGFTLIELLVVISIMAILMSLVLVGVTGSQKQARDTQRRNDLAQYRIALESYAASNGTKYPGYALATVQTLATVYTDHLSSYIAGGALADPLTSGACADTPTPGKLYCYFEDGSADGATASNYVIYSGLETGGWWEVCSTGKSGKVTTLPADSACDL